MHWIKGRQNILFDSYAGSFANIYFYFFFFLQYFYTLKELLLEELLFCYNYRMRKKNCLCCSLQAKILAMIISLPLNIYFSTYSCNAWILLWRILDWSNSNIGYLYCSAGSRSRTRTSKETEYRLSLSAGHFCGVLFVGLGFLFIFTFRPHSKIWRLADKNVILSPAT